MWLTAQVTAQEMLKAKAQTKAEVKAQKMGTAWTQAEAVVAHLLLLVWHRKRIRARPTASLGLAVPP